MRPIPKIAIILAFALTAKANVYAQNIFQKRSDLNYSFDMFSSVFASDTGFFTLGQAIADIPSDSSNNHFPERRLIMTWYDWQGNVIKEKYLVRNKTDYYSMWYSSDAIFGNGFYHIGGLKDSLTTTSPNTSDLFLTRLNWNADTVWTKRYDSGYWDNGATGLVANNGDFLAASNFLAVDNKYKVRLLRIDSLGNIIWNRTYSNGYNITCNYIIKDNEGNFYLSGQANIDNTSGSNPKNLRSTIMKIDSLGTLLWMKYITGICNGYSGGIVFAADGHILMANRKCYDQPAANVVYSSFSIVKVNKVTGDTIWQSEYPIQYDNNEHPNFIKILNNGDIVTGGVGLKLFIDGEDTLYGRNTGVLIRTDSLGNMKWQRYYFYNIVDAQNMAFSEFYDGTLTPDGGFVLVGRTTHASDFDDGWIIKTDENGCIDLSCVNGIEELDDEDFRLFLYPNPAEEYVSIDLPIQYNKGILQVYNMQGQLLKSSTITTGGTQSFSISDLPNGIYQLVVYSNTNKLLGREKLVVAR